MNVRDKLKSLPDKPGVYLMKDEMDRVIYVGKAKNLKKRVRQYFGSYGRQAAKVRAMVSHIHDFEYIIVENEVESLLLEQNLIKEKHPKYNILLRDDKRYPYIKVTVQERFPRVMKTRLVKKDGARYFGPYPNALAVNEAIALFHKLYPLRECNWNLEKHRGKIRPCLNFFIGRCMAPCKEDVSEEEYRSLIHPILRFLEGKDDTLLKDMKEKMKKAAANLHFEEAVQYRDGLKSLEHLMEKQSVAHIGRDDDWDVLAIARGDEEICVQVFFIRGGDILGREHFFLQDAFQSSVQEILHSFLGQFYANATLIPREILVEEEPEDATALETWLTSRAGHKVHLHAPQKGKKVDLLRMAKKNALDMLTKYADQYTKKQKKTWKILEELAQTIGLPEAPRRIETYDISNISGVESVGSMVVFEEGQPKKSDYRKFRIKHVVGPDDYGSMREVLERRFLRALDDTKEGTSNSFSLLPDLILIDGGKGQVNAVLEVRNKLGLDLPVAGLVKDDFHRTRGIVYEGVEYPLEVNTALYRLLFQMQEEAHRFALNYHHSLHKKSAFRSELDDVKGIGPKRKNALMKAFRSLEKMKAASVEELAGVEGMNQRAAEELYRHFHGVSL